MEDSGLLYDVRDHAAWLTINREASRNSLNPDVIALFFQHLDRAEADPEVRAICITGAGERAFCAGADLASAFSGDDPVAAPVAYARLLARLLDSPVPTIARVNGVCLGGGVGLALACDIAIARAGVRIGTPEVRVGVFPMIIAPLVLRHVPRRRAIEMMFTGEIVTSEEAAAIGLVTRTVPPADLDVAVRASLDALFAASPSSIRLGRQALADVEGLPVREAIGRLPEWLMKVLATDDAAEGISAFMEKRAPLWKHPR